MTVIWLMFETTVTVLSIHQILNWRTTTRRVVWLPQPHFLNVARHLNYAKASNLVRLISSQGLAFFCWGEFSWNIKKIGGHIRNRTGVHGFAIRCVTTPPCGLIFSVLQMPIMQPRCPYCSFSWLFCASDAHRASAKSNRIGAFRE